MVTGIRGLTPPARLALLALLAVLPAGCFNSHNPSYFPYYFPGGRIQQEHAKPSFGYFRDFDPKACRIEVTPRDSTAPLNAPIVLVATVTDKDGQPRRSRRVEWLLEGPGMIVEADETGFYAGRGYKVDNKYAVSYTSYKGGTITRGNDDPKDDIEFTPGQTFCVVSSAVPGETTITAYAPGVFNWENGRVVAKIVWGEGRFRFPESAVVRSGGEHTMTTAVTQDPTGPDLSGYRVRYQVRDGDAPAVLVAAAGASQSGTEARQAEAPFGADGAADVRLVQPTARLGKTRVLVEVVKPPEGGTGPGKVVGRRETVIEWASPALRLDVTAPQVAVPNAPYPAVVTLANTGAVDGSKATARVTLSDGATLESSDPPPTKLDGSALVFELPAVAAGGRQEVALKVRPAKDHRGPVKVAATVDGFKSPTEAAAVTRVEAGKLAVTVEAPAAAVTGGRVPVRVAVTNTGATPAVNATAFARFGPPLTHTDGKSDVEFAAGTLTPGQTKTFDLPLTASAGGRSEVRATATADGGLAATAAPAAVAVRKAGLTAGVAGPKLAYVGQEFTWTLTVTNAGEVEAANVQVRAVLPPEVKLIDAGGGTAGAGSVEWQLAGFRPGEAKTFNLLLEGGKLADRAAVTVAAVAELPGGDPVEAKAEAAVAVIGTPAVVLEVTPPPGLVEVGKRATVRVRVRNPGTVSARDVEVTAVAPAEFKLIRASGPGEPTTDAAGKVTFRPVEQLRPGETVTVVIELEAVKAGDARFRAEVSAAHLSGPLQDEQAVRVVGGR